MERYRRHAVYIVGGFVLLSLVWIVSIRHNMQHSYQVLDDSEYEVDGCLSSSIHQDTAKRESKFGACALRGDRLSMEDATVAGILLNSPTCPTLILFGVFDGHNSKEIAPLARDLLIKYLYRNLESHCTDATTSPELLTAILNRSISDTDAALCARPALTAAGTTAAIAVVSPNRFAIIANVGDSRIVLSRAGGAAVDLTRDHKPEDPLERQRIEQSGGRVSQSFFSKWFGDPKNAVWRVDGVLATSRSLGNAALKRHGVSAVPDLVTLNINDKDSQIEFIIIATDGIWSVLDSATAVGIVRRQLAIGIGERNRSVDVDELVQHAAQVLVHEACTRGGCHDNLSAVVVDLGLLQKGA